MAWNATARPLRVGICIASKGPTTIEWSVTLAEAVAQAGVPVDLFYSKHFRLDFAREDMVENAIKSGCSHVLFFDSDLFPCRWEPSVRALVPAIRAAGYYATLEYPIVAALYWTKRDMWNAFRVIENTDEPEVLDGTIEELHGHEIYMEGVGLGFCLIDIRVFAKIPRPWFRYVREGNDRTKEISEDFYFCLKAKQAGFLVMLNAQVIGKHGMTMYLIEKDVIAKSLALPERAPEGPGA